jgi:hypothetical protein
VCGTASGDLPIHRRDDDDLLGDNVTLDQFGMSTWNPTSVKKLAHDTGAVGQRSTERHGDVPLLLFRRLTLDDLHRRAGSYVPGRVARLTEGLLGVDAGGAAHLFAELLDAGLDRVVLALPVEHPEIEAIKIFTDHFVLTMPTSRQFANRIAEHGSDDHGAAARAVRDGSARETYRLPVRDLGNPGVVPMAKPDYERLRAASIRGAAPAQKMIDGMTKLIAHIGYPTQWFKSPIPFSKSAASMRW